MSGIKQSAFALAAVVLMSGACAHRGEPVQDDLYANEDTSVRVSNFNWSDMTIYLVAHGTRQRLGTVTTNSVASFRIPTHVAASGEVYLVADPIGSAQTYRSAPVVLGVGQRAEWRLENAIQLSSFWIR